MSATVEAQASDMLADHSSRAVILGDHAGWIWHQAQDRAAATYLEMLAGDSPDAGEALLSTGQRIWEQAGIDLARDVRRTVVLLGDGHLLDQAPLFAIEVYLRRLFDLSRTSGQGGSA